MDNLLTVAFEAHNAEKNHHRLYQVTVGRDLLDDWTVTVRYGRTGQGGREMRFASPRPDDMRAVIRDRLLRRLSVPKRIGCPYRLGVFSAAPGLDASAWLPGESPGDQGVSVIVVSTVFVHYEFGSIRPNPDYSAWIQQGGLRLRLTC